MARNIVLSGLRRLTVIAPATAAVGDVVVVNRMFGIALTSAASAASVSIDTGATATIRKLNGASTSQAAGTNVHWDATNANATTSATSNLLLGVAASATANADTSITVHLNPAF